MGQKVNPISNRLGIVRGWDSNWFGGKDFGDNLVEDQKIRKYLNERLAKASVSKIVIERTLKRMRPAPQGRGYRIRKRSNHVTLFVDAKTNDVKE